MRSCWACDADGVPLLLFGSDVGHWDVTDVGEVLVEAYELVEDGLITEADFKEFVYTNAVQMHAGVNPDFFKGTAVESDVDRYLRQEARP